MARTVWKVGERQGKRERWSLEQGHRRRRIAKPPDELGVPFAPLLQLLDGRGEIAARWQRANPESAVLIRPRGPDVPRGGHPLLLFGGVQNHDVVLHPLAASTSHRARHIGHIVREG